MTDAEATVPRDLKPTDERCAVERRERLFAVGAGDVPYASVPLVPAHSLVGFDGCDGPEWEQPLRARW